MNSIDSKLAYLKNQIALTRQKLNQVWAVNQKTDKVVLVVSAELDELCNEYERLMKGHLRKK
ncbi:MAG: Spo0E family sporulation regulatory protein-aspartic acid phosphatase [Bacteroidota bacterium]